MIVALLAIAASVVDAVNSSMRQPQSISKLNIGLSLAAIVVVAIIAFLVVFFIESRLEHSHELAQRILEQAAIPTTAGSLDGLWVAAVSENGKLLGGSIFTIQSSVSKGFAINGVFHELENGLLKRDPSGLFHGKGAKIDDSSFIYFYKGRESGPSLQENHDGTGHYNFYGLENWVHQNFSGHFSISGSRQVRIVNGKRCSMDKTLEPQSEEAFKSLEAFIKPDLKPSLPASAIELQPLQPKAHEPQISSGHDPGA